MTTTAPRPANPVDHSPLEDAFAFFTGTMINAFALTLLSSVGLITGQIAGLSILTSYVTGWPFGAVFFVLNLPFYWFGYRRLGTRFMVKTLICVALVSALISWMPTQVHFANVTPWVAAVLFGLLAGTSLLVVFRHGASLGGIGILALYIQDKSGIKAGHVQLGFDALLFTVALFILPLDKVGYSLLGAVVLNQVIAFNHRRDRYIAM